MGTSSTGLNENIASVLCYAGGWVTGIIFILLENSSRTVRFNAWQSLFLFGGITVANMVLHLLPGIGRVLEMLLTLAGVVLWVLLMLKSYRGESVSLPVVGDLARAKL